jgi:hypothetical protein
LGLIDDEHFQGRAFSFWSWVVDFPHIFDSLLVEEVMEGYSCVWGKSSFAGVDCNCLL